MATQDQNIDPNVNPNANYFDQGQGGNPTPAASPTPINTTTPSPTPSNVPTTAPASGTINPTNPSIVDALNASGKPSDFTSRSALATQYGITGYKGTADQNTQLLQKYTAGLAAAKAGGTPPPNSQGDASAAVTGITGGPTPPPPPPNPIETQMNNDPGFQQLLQDQKDYLSSQNQQTSLADEYTKLTADAGIPALNTQLINMKTIMDGTEQDIRNEITKAGGFATESQVLALTSARNKTMITNYNNLLQTRDDAVSQVNTTMGFAKEDQANAQAVATEKMNFDSKVSDYYQKMTANAQDAYNNIIKTPGYGYQALLDSAGGDPNLTKQIEQTLNMQPGMLAQLGSITPPGKYSVVKGGTDAYGNPLPDQIFNSQTGQFGSGGSRGNSTGSYSDTSGVGAGGTSQASGTGIIGSNNLGISASKLPFAQYGLLANTNLNPNTTKDQLAVKALDQYLKNGTVPTASSLGRNMKPEAVGAVDSRMRDLYYQATGTAMPNPEVIKGYQQILTANNKLANNLQVQEQTVNANVDLSIANMKKFDLNSSNFQPLNNFINSVQTMFSDPATGQLIAQNSTIQNELGSLLAVKNASGTTVFDKMASAGIISKNDTQAVITAKVGALLQEATNFAGSLANANANMYKQVDPLLQDPNNPARNQMIVETALNKTGTNYNTVISKTPQGQMPVLDIASGNVGYITPGEFSASKYIKL